MYAGPQKESCSHRKNKKVGMNFQTHPRRHPDACVEVWVFRQLPNRLSALCCQKLFSAADNGDERCHRLPFPGMWTFLSNVLATSWVSVHAQLCLPHTASTSVKKAANRHQIMQSNEVSSLQQATKLLKSEAVKFKWDILILF